MLDYLDGSGARSVDFGCGGFVVVAHLLTDRYLADEDNQSLFR
ncbi:MAG: hypothetical protein RI568_14310 [Natronomonas sp.]|nr:hypothetical protein [Natronomonas sp.]MDR9431855.1 hypothetical protein [Natronomonas sp.]